MPLGKLFQKRGSRKDKKEVSTKTENTAYENLSSGAKVETVEEQLSPVQNGKVEDTHLPTTECGKEDVQPLPVERLSAEEAQLSAVENVSAEDAKIESVNQQLLSVKNQYSEVIQPSYVEKVNEELQPPFVENISAKFAKTDIVNHQLPIVKNRYSEYVQVPSVEEVNEVKPPSIQNVIAEEIQITANENTKEECKPVICIPHNDSNEGDKPQTENVLIHRPEENFESSIETDTAQQLAEGSLGEVTKIFPVKGSSATIKSTCNYDYGKQGKDYCSSAITSKDNRCVGEENGGQRVRKHKYRSGSQAEETLKTIERDTSRRKFGSESEVLKISGDCEDRIIQMKEKDLEQLINRCVNKIIRGSIATAADGGNLNSLYKANEMSFTDSRDSESSESCALYVVEQKLPCEALYEYVEEDYISNSGRSNIPRDEADCLGEDHKDEDSTDCEVEDIRDNGLDGYQADCEENSSIYSSVSDSSFKKVETQETDLENTTPNDSQEMTISETNCEHDSNLSQDLDVSNRIPTHIDTAASLPEGSNLQENKGRESPELSKTRGSTITESSDFVRTRGSTITESSELILMSLDENISSQSLNNSTDTGTSDNVQDFVDNLTEQNFSEEEKKVNWKVGYLHVKLPHKSRGKGHLKVWKKRCVAIQLDEFVNDPKYPSLMISVYSADSGKHGAIFWKSVSCQKAVVYRSNSRTHPYAFTVSDDSKAVIHLAGDSESMSQEWMAAIRAIFWPPSPVVQLEKMLYGNEFEVSMIDNEFAFHAGLLGTYGYLTITPKKLILIHPQQGYVIQEWYLNTVDKFQLMPQSKIEDVHKVLAMTTCSDSSTGKGEILMYCKESLALLQSLATTIHHVLSFHSKQEGGKYQKELEEIAEWLLPATTQTTCDETTKEEYYKVPPRQVKSLLDIPNFIFEKPLTPVASAACAPGTSMDLLESSLDASKTNTTTSASRDSGISSENVADDFLNCSVTSFVVGGGAFPGKSSDSELSDSYTPPRSPELKKKIISDDELATSNDQTAVQ
ncbi:uncharacterized protein LOC118196938 [Stegodyphus dumicola]|uniref:uncharacterized protein LOC118196938 n=1 Tax=Stegodyphus dumicola TaxID=202533 RepID=UPI0015AE7CF9|nr:uncharacterized protein LOC118196938 [Stegodyphus dumicola]